MKEKTNSRYMLTSEADIKASKDFNITLADIV